MPFRNINFKNIFFGHEVDFTPTQQSFLQGSNVLVITDQNTHNECYPLVEPFLPKHTVLEVPAGEKFKNLDTCQIIWQKMTDLQLDRKSLVVNLGGGVIGDMGGFCAATYKRGIRFVQMPTTLLSQVDASVGGKLGIDFQGFKNHIGVFTEPQAVFIFTAFLDSLPGHELRSGFAEVVKHALIDDAKLWNQLKDKENWFDQNWPELVKRSVATKYRIVLADPKEENVRKKLNLGHTVGHAIESFYLETKNKRLHGEAVAAGLVTEAYIANQMGILPDGYYQEIKNYIKGVFFPLKIPVQHIDPIVELCLQDKKNEHGNILLVLPESPGTIKINVQCEQSLIKEALIALWKKD